MPNRRLPTRESYRRAQVAARNAELAIEARQAREIAAAMRHYGDELARGIARLPGGERGVRESVALMRRSADRLEREIARLTGEGRTLGFEKIQEIWTKAGLDVARIEGVPEALLGAVRAPPVSLLGAYEAVGGANHWRTLIPRYVANAAEEANAIVRGALLQGVSPEQLARRLRPYVSGAEPFHKAFKEMEGVDLRQLKAHDRQAARALNYNARRIAVSETHNARSEAEVQHFINDPLVRAVAWRLAPDRGSVEGGDECDVLATEDFYGLGPGIYPVDQVPITPHPFDRCERVPITQDEPSENRLGMKPLKGSHEAKLPRGLTETRADRLRERLDNVMVRSYDQPALSEAGRAVSASVPPRGPSPSIVPTRPFAESRRAMREEFGIQMIGGTRVSPSVADEMGTYMLEGLRDLRAIGLEIPPGYTFHIDDTLRAGINATHRVQTIGRDIHLSIRFTPGDSQRQLLGHSRSLKKNGWLASDHARSTVHHEVGHALHRERLGHLDFQDLRAAGWPGDTEAKIARQVSRYATTHPGEFVAETFSGLVNGERYSDEVMALYKKYNGPVVKRSLGQTTVTEKALEIRTTAAPASKIKPAPVAVREAAIEAPKGAWQSGLPSSSTGRDIIRKGLTEGIDPDDIIAEVKRLNPTSRVSKATVRKVKRELARKGGLTREVEKRVTSTRAVEGRPPQARVEAALGRADRIARDEFGETSINLDDVFKRHPKSVPRIPDEAVFQAPIERVDLSKVVISQDQATVDLDQVKRFIRGDIKIPKGSLNEAGWPDDLPIVLQQRDGTYMMIEGHHRLTSKILLQENFAEVRVIKP